MSFEFQSTLVNVTPTFRIGGNQIGGVRIEYANNIKVARVIVTNDADAKFALSGPFESGDPDAIYAALAPDLYEIAPGILLNEGAIGSVDSSNGELIIDLEGDDRRYKFIPDAVVTGPEEYADHTWKLPQASFDALVAASATWRSSMDGTLEGLSTAITTEVSDRIAADAAIQSDVDQNEADSDAADAALSGRLDVLEADPTTATAVAAVQADVDQNEADSDAAEAALSGRLDVLEADPTTATAVAAVQADVDQNEADSDAAEAALSGRLDVLEADPTTATAVAAVQADVDQNETDGDAADAALSGRLDVLEADPTTATAVAAVQADVDQNEADADAAIAGEATTRGNADTALSDRLDVLEADPTTATALTDGLALKANKAGDTFTGDIIIDEGTGSTIKLETSDATSAGIHIEGPTGSMGYIDTTNGFGNDSLQVYSANFWVRASNNGTGNVIVDGQLTAPGLVNAANDGDAATAGVPLNGLYHHNGDMKIRVS